MGHKFFILLIALLTTGLHWNCSEDSSKSNKSDTAQSNPISVSQLDSVWYSPDCVDTLNCTFFSVSYVQVQAGLEAAVQDSINTYIVNMIAAGAPSLKAAADSFFDFYLAHKRLYLDSWEDDLPREDYPSYEFQHSVEHLPQTNFSESFAYTFYEYTGGAHGIYDTRYLNFDNQTGKLIQRDELLVPKRALLDTAQYYFRLARGIPAKESPLANYWFDGDTFYLPDNFLIVEDSLHFSYSVYEIASYVEGQISFNIPYRSLAPFLKPTFQHLASPQLP